MERGGVGFMICLSPIGEIGKKLSGETGGRKNVRDSNENVPDPHAST